MNIWNWEPTLLLGLALQAVGYLACVGPLRRWFPGATPVSSARIQVFLLGTLTLFLALVSPLDVLGDDYLLSAHMVQHLLLTLVAPPLLLLGTPRWLFRPLLRIPLALPIGRVLTNPLVAFALFNITFDLWHLPSLYEATLHQLDLHILEHLMFIATATLTWWPIFSPLDELPAIPIPLQFLYLFLQTLPPTVLGALIAFSGTILYPTYARTPRIWGITPQVDQQLGGLIMWIPGGLVFFIVLSVIFLRWISREEYEPASEGLRG